MNLEVGKYYHGNPKSSDFRSNIYCLVVEHMEDGDVFVQWYHKESNSIFVKEKIEEYLWNQLVPYLKSIISKKVTLV